MRAASRPASMVAPMMKAFSLAVFAFLAVALGQTTALTPSSSCSVIVRYGNVQSAGVTISAALFRASHPIADAIVTVTVSTGDVNIAATATMLDNGNSANGDAKMGDGLYSVILGGLRPAFYVATVEATLQSGAVLIDSEFFEVYPITATLTGAVRDAGIDVNGDKMIDRIDFSAGVDVQRDGGYALRVLLRASNGNEAWTSGGYAGLTSGNAEVVTSISAKELKEKLGVDGPYELESVRLYWSPSGPNPIAEHIASELDDMGETAPYALSALTRTYLQFVRYVGDEGIDVDNNGRFNVIRVSFEIDSAIIESYMFTYSAHLIPVAGLPEDGRPSFAKNQQPISVGLNTLTLDFPLEDYGGSAVAGPYLVTELSLYPSSRLPNPYGSVRGDRLQEVPSVLGTTRAYSLFELEGGRPGDIPGEER